MGPSSRTRWRSAARVISATASVGPSGVKENRIPNSCTRPRSTLGYRCLRGRWLSGLVAPLGERGDSEAPDPPRVRPVAPGSKLSDLRLRESLRSGVWDYGRPSTE